MSSACGVPRLGSALKRVISGTVAAAFGAIEKDASTWDGVWWAVTTITTVGYGYEFRRTNRGRVLRISIMLVSIGFIAIVTGAVAERFLSGQVEEARRGGGANRGDRHRGACRAREARSRLDRLEERLAKRGGA
jgi:voltage-gated potassium channel